MNITFEIEALVASLQAQKAEARAVILRYTDNDSIASIGEHPDIMGILRENFAKWDNAQSQLESIQKFAQQEAQIEARFLAAQAKQEEQDDQGANLSEKKPKKVKG